jgi:hypothetical protein
MEDVQSPPPPPRVKAASSRAKWHLNLKIAGDKQR